MFISLENNWIYGHVTMADVIIREAIKCSRFDPGRRGMRCVSVVRNLCVYKVRCRDLWRTQGDTKRGTESALPLSRSLVSKTASSSTSANDAAAASLRSSIFCNAPIFEWSIPSFFLFNYSSFFYVWGGSYLKTFQNTSTYEEYSFLSPPYLSPRLRTRYAQNMR